jgi:FHS family L-fucose permease-like MFS transporter
MSDRKNSYVVPMIIIGALFFVFGFLTWLNGTLIPYLKIACQLKSDLQSFLVTTAFFIAYTIMAIPSSYVLRKTGYKKGMALGLLIMAVGAILFVPAANAREFNLFLLGLFIIGTGLTILQIASNPYVSIIGPHESAAMRISIMGICNKVAGILAGIIFGYIALKDADLLEQKLKTMDLAGKEVILNDLAGRVVVPYMIIAGCLVLLAIAIMFSSLPDIQDEATEQGSTVKTNDKTSAFQYPHLVLGVIALFLYVGVETLAGDTIISYGKSIGIELNEARFFTQWTLGGMLIGYIIGIAAIPKYLSQTTALKICAVLGVVFTLLAVVTSGKISVMFIALLGLANSLMWPAIFPLAIHGLGKFTKIGSAYLIMAISGAAVFPLLYGKLSQVLNTREAYLIIIPSYLFILYFATKGYKAGKTELVIGSN